MMSGNCSQQVLFVVEGLHVTLILLEEFLQTLTTDGRSVCHISGDKLDNIKLLESEVSLSGHQV